MYSDHGDMVRNVARQVRRAVDTHQTLQHLDGQLAETYQIPTHVIITLGVSAVLCLIFLTFVRYTLWGVVSTLAQIEVPQTVYMIREEKVARGSDALTEECVDTEYTMIKEKPITAKIRTAIRHLTAQGGWRARWRGLSVFVVYAVAHSMLSGFLANLLGAFHYPHMGTVYLAKSLGSVIATILLARLSTAWVHIVISEPSAKAWYRRVPGMRSWKNVWAPAALVDVTTRLAFALPAMCAFALGLGAEGHADHPGMVAFKLLVCVSLGLVTLIALVIPSTVALVRVQASMLPEEDETIVPFDRTFGGKVVPEILGGSGAVGYVDAWRTFDMASRARIIKLFFKFVAIEIGMHLFFFLLLGLEAFFMLKPEQRRILLGQGQN